MTKTTKYCYYTKDNELSYLKFRADNSDGSKKFIFKQPNGTMGIDGLKHLLYNLPDVLKADTVYFVEGEKCADALIKLGYSATTLDRGANSKWQPEFSEWLKDKEVIILPDNDEPGMKYARTVKDGVPWAVIKQLPDLDKKEDVFDWLQKGHTIDEIEAIPETILEKTEEEDDSDTEEIKDRLTQSSALLDFIKKENVELFLNEEHEPYVEIFVGGHRETLPLKSETFSNWLEYLYYRKTGKTILANNLNQVKNILAAEAKFGVTPCVKLNNRVAKHENSFWYDLANDSYSAVKISKDGWSVENSTSKLFYRFNHQSKQVIPKTGGNINNLFKYINLKEYKLLFICWLVSCYVPDIPHPMPIIYGEKGAAKSTTCALLKRLIDPSAVGNISLNKDEKSLILNLKKHYYLPFDNVSAISNDVSDTLCRAITGGALQQRKLYTDSEDCIYTFKRCLTINGINNVANRADLLDRSILIELERISAENRKNEQDVYADFEADRPYLLGGIFDILSKAMSIFPDVNLSKLPRMADFCRWGYAIAEAMNGQGDEFLKEYDSNQAIQNVEAINADNCAYLIVEFMRYEKDWNGRVSDLFQKLQAKAKDLGLNPNNKSILPQAPNALSRRIKSAKSNLEAVGITFEFDVGTNASGTYIHLYNNLYSLPSYQVDVPEILEHSNVPCVDNGGNGDKNIVSNYPNGEDDDYSDVEW